MFTLHAVCWKDTCKIAKREVGVSDQDYIICTQFTLSIQRDTPEQTVPVITKTCLFKYIENFTTKNWKFSDKNSDIFHTSAQNIDCEYSSELPQCSNSNEYPQSMFLSRNKKNNVYPCKPQFYYIKVGFKWVNIIQAYFRDVTL